MKKLLVSLAATAALTLTAFAQNFEGTITWSLKYDMGAAMGGQQAQQMQQMQQMMNDPAIQAQMQAAMNNPMMQQMMAQDPRMKAMMDNMGRGAAGGAGGAGAMNSMLPQGVTVKIKGNSSLAIIEGGMAAGEVLTLADKNLAYMIDRPSRTYTTTNEAAVGAAAPAGQFKITKTTETTKILGYTCTKTLVEETTGRGQVSSYVVWATSEIAGANSKQFSKLKLTDRGDTSFMSSIEGVPLRMEVSAQGVKMTMEASAVKKEPLADSVFTLPAGFTERKLPQM